MRGFDRRLAMGGAAGLILTMAASAAAAQTAEASPTSPPPSTAPEASEPTVIGEIFVTARKREETLQNVPTPVSAFSEETLSRRDVTDLKGLDGVVPNMVSVAALGSTNASAVFLRGVGNDDPGFTNESPIGVYLDDIYAGRQVGALVDIADIQRIEVLRGPQGTLYGRNATGGAVKYVTIKPNLSEYSFGGEATLGNFERRDLKLHANIPLVEDTLGLRLSGTVRRQEGWIDLVDANGVETGDKANGVDTYGARAALRWRPQDNLTVDLAIDGAVNASGVQAPIPVNCKPPALAFTERCPLLYGERKSYFGLKDDIRFESWGLSGVVEWDLDRHAFRSISAYRTFEDRYVTNLGANPARSLNILQDMDQKQFQQEFQLSSNYEGRFNWIGGLFYLKEEIDSDAQFIIFRNDDQQTSTSYAIYGEAYYDLTDRLELTLGGRYSWEEKDIDRAFYSNFANTSPTNVYSGDFSSDRFTPKVGLSYQFDRVLVFATYAQGVRPGGWAAPRPSSPAQQVTKLTDEVETSYEVGFKSSMFDRKVRFNVTAFLAEYENLQFTTLINGGFQVVPSDAEYKGVEIDAAWNPLPGLSFDATLGLMDAKYTKLPTLIPTAREPKHVPDITLSVSGQYDFALGFAPGEGFIGAGVTHVGEAYRTLANEYDTLTPAYTVIDARIGYRSPDDRWTVSLGGKNLADNSYYMAGTGTYTRYYGTPRQIYLSLKMNY